MTELGEFAKYLASGFVALGFLFGPIGSAIARRIGGSAQQRGPDPAEFDEMRARLTQLESQELRLAELEERVDFAERLLAGGATPAQLQAREDQR